MITPPPRLDVRVRPYDADDRESVRALLRKTFGSSEVFDRFATGNPLGRFVAVVAQHAGAVVGFNMWNPWLIHSASGPLTAYQSGASAVDEAMRGQGIFGKLLRAGEEVARGHGIVALFGFPNPASLPGFLKAGWEHARSLRLFISTVPSLGVGPLLAHPAASTSVPSTASARFVAWRYAQAGVTPRSALLPCGRAVTVYARTERHRGASVNKLLDVLDADGRRVTRGLGTVAARLPGPGVAIMRAVAAPQARPPWLALRRRWETPFIFKRLSGGAPDDHALREATYWYGDIDAS